jgi:hypothetical protein
VATAVAEAERKANQMLEWEREKVNRNTLEDVERQRKRAEKAERELQTRNMPGQDAIEFIPQCTWKHCQSDLQRVWDAFGCTPMFCFAMQNRLVCKAKQE